MKYKVGFSIDVTHKNPFQLLEQAIEKKLDYIEFKADNPLIDPERVTQEKKKRLLDIISTTNIKVTYHGPYLGINLVGPGEWIVEASLKRIKSSIGFAAELEAEYFLIHGGRIYHDYLVWDQILEKSWNEFVKNVDKLSSFASKVGLEVVIENTTPSTNTNLIDNVSRMHQLIEELENIGLVVDIGHLNLTSNVYSIEKAIKNDYFREHLKGFHIHNNNGKKDEHLSFNNGKVDYQRLKQNVFSALKDKIYICEVGTVCESVAFKNFLEKIN